MGNLGGYKPESYNFKDFSFKKAFGLEKHTDFKPLNTDISGVPIVYQGYYPGCVSATVSWIKSFLEIDKPTLSWQWLAQVSGTTEDGIVPSKVFKVARAKGIAENLEGLNAEKHKIGNFFYVALDKESIYDALVKSKVLALGLSDWEGNGPHFVACYDITSDGLRWKCVNWDNPLSLSLIEVPMDLVDDCVAFGEAPLGTSLSVPLFDVLKDKYSMLSSVKKIFSGLVVGLTALISVLFGTTQTTSQEPTAQQYGAAGVPGEYATQIAQAIYANSTSIPAVSRTLFTGELFSDADLFHPISLALGKGTSREYASCDFFQTTSTYPTFIGCLRGVSAISTSTAITVVPGAAVAHTAGESLSITNQPAYFRNMVDTHTNQDVGGIKTFTSRQINLGSTTTELVVTGGKAGWSDDGGLTSFTFAGGSSGLTASSSKGIFIIASQIGVNASSTAGLAFDTSGLLYVNASSTSSTNGGYLKFNTLGQLYWDIASFLQSSSTWLGNQTFAGINSFVATSTIAKTGPFIGSTELTNKLYQDLESTTATGTTAHSTTAGQALFFTTTSTLAITDTSAATSTFYYVGLAEETVASGATVRYTKPGGTNCFQSGLVPGTPYYLNGSNGQVSATPATNFARIGLATSAVCIQLTAPKFIARGTTAITGTGSTVVTTGFYPAKVNVRAAPNGVIQGGMSVGDDTNTAAASLGGGTGSTAAYLNNRAWYIYDPGSSTVKNEGTIISKTVFGFTFNTLTFNSGGANLMWEASSE